MFGCVSVTLCSVCPVTHDRIESHLLARVSMIVFDNL